MSKGLKIMSLGVINHGMSLSVLYQTSTKTSDLKKVSKSVSDFN